MVAEAVLSIRKSGQGKRLNDMSTASYTVPGKVFFQKELILRSKHAGNPLTHDRRAASIFETDAVSTVTGNKEGDGGDQPGVVSVGQWAKFR